MRMRTLKLLLFAALILLAPAAAMADGNGRGGGGGNHSGGNHGCNNPCGAQVEVMYCFDQDIDSACADADHAIELSSPLYSINLYNEEWTIISTQIPGRDDGDLWNENDAGTTKFRGLRAGVYNICAVGLLNVALGGNAQFTYPTSNSPDPSNRIRVVSNQSLTPDEGEWCFEIDVRRDCSYSVEFAWWDAD